MISKKNPFAELYVTESIGTETFARLFSPLLAQETQTHALFQPGNIVLTGFTGFWEDGTPEPVAARSDDLLS